MFSWDDADTFFKHNISSPKRKQFVILLDSQSHQPIFAYTRVKEAAIVTINQSVTCETPSKINDDLIGKWYNFKIIKALLKQTHWHNVI